MRTSDTNSVPTAGPSLSPAVPTIVLTLTQAEGHQRLCVKVSELITYSENQNRTELRLTNRRRVEVRESTGQIDQLVRRASAQRYAAESLSSQTTI